MTTPRWHVLQRLEAGERADLSRGPCEVDGLWTRKAVPRGTLNGLHRSVSVVANTDEKSLEF